MATWFEIIYTGDPTEDDYARVSRLAADGFTSGQLINDPHTGDNYNGGMHEHDGYAPHSHEVRADHLGVDKS